MNDSTYTPQFEPLISTTYAISAEPPKPPIFPRNPYQEQTSIETPLEVRPDSDVLVLKEEIKGLKEDVARLENHVKALKILLEIRFNELRLEICERNEN